MKKSNFYFYFILALASAAWLFFGFSYDKWWALCIGSFLTGALCVFLILALFGKAQATAAAEQIEKIIADHREALESKDSGFDDLLTD
jgi:hypothetical protein